MLQKISNILPLDYPTNIIQGATGEALDWRRLTTKCKYAVLWKSLRLRLMQNWDKEQFCVTSSTTSATSTAAATAAATAATAAATAAPPPPPPLFPSFLGAPVLETMF